MPDATLTVRELIECLEGHDPELPVHMKAESHDYWGGTLGVPVVCTEATTVHWSEYHRMWEAGRDQKDADPDDESRDVVLLSYELE